MGRWAGQVRYGKCAGVNLQMRHAKVPKQDRAAGYGCALQQAFALHSVQGELQWHQSIILADYLQCLGEPNCLETCSITRAEVLRWVQQCVALSVPPTGGSPGTLLP